MTASAAARRCSRRPTNSIREPAGRALARPLDGAAVADGARRILGDGPHRSPVHTLRRGISATSSTTGRRRRAAILPQFGVAETSGRVSAPLTEERRRIVEAVARVCDRFDADYWRERERAGSFPHEFHAAMAGGRLARRRHAGGSRRRRLGRHRSGADDAHRRRVGRGDERLFGDPYEHFRPPPHRRLRHGGAKAAISAAADRGSRESLFRGYRTRRRPRHDAGEDPRETAGERLRHRWAQGLEFRPRRSPTRR